MYSFFVFLSILSYVVCDGYYGSCFYKYEQQEIGLVAGSNPAFYYVDQLNSAAYYNHSFPILEIYYNDVLISSPTEGYNLVGTQGAPLFLATWEDNRVIAFGNPYFTFEVQEDNAYMFSSQVQYFGLRIQNIFTTIPNSLSCQTSFISGGVNRTLFNGAQTSCFFSSPGVYDCIQNDLSSFGPTFDITTISTIYFNIYPNCAAITTGSSYCANNGYMNCISSTQFETCSNGNWAAPQSCESGTYCNQNGNYIYCGYTNPSTGGSTTTSGSTTTTTTTTTTTSTTAALTTSATPITSGSTPITSGSTTGSATCTVGNTKCTGTTTYETCVYVMGSGGWVGGWGSDQNCPAGTHCVQYSTYIGCS